MYRRTERNGVRTYGHVYLWNRDPSQTFGWRWRSRRLPARHRMSRRRSDSLSPGRQQLRDRE
ncbi:PE-PGRS family domain protein [Mycobacterium ulcerans str. Harvey]|uniref:PE-PGRS family domain protein n=1 Tax=Mycobacterium ulcerans str. Harvey TaxID=1299332 RepID=A0ABN0QMI7_MYCUL|nr:PE-PGRS family domain protein [Mycobacterium ulcerans str. Harvey]